MKNLTLLLILFLGFSACKQVEKKAVHIKKEYYGTTKEGKEVDRYTLSNDSGMKVHIITFGGIITHLYVPNATGGLNDVVLGYDSLSDYEKGSPYFGALIGRYGNRIADGTFTLDDQTYSLVQNDGKNHLHGGTKGFDKVVWDASSRIENGKAVLQLNYLSKDMEEGYPGNLNTEVTYTLSKANILEVSYRATTDKKTVLNLTQHAYFNLSGTADILNHELKLNAPHYLPVDEILIPTGEIASVAGTPFDFTSFKAIGRDIKKEDIQLERGLGYDHCWVLDDSNKGLRSAAILQEVNSGIQLEVFTDQPAIQFYSGNFLDGTNPN
jgi:aldose 1-epimerase